MYYFTNIILTLLFVVLFFIKYLTSYDCDVFFFHCALHEHSVKKGGGGTTSLQQPLIMMW